MVVAQVIMNVWIGSGSSHNSKGLIFVSGQFESFAVERRHSPSRPMFRIIGHRTICAFAYLA